MRPHSVRTARLTRLARVVPLAAVVLLAGAAATDARVPSYTSAAADTLQIKITGRVTDAASGRPVEGAQVVVQGTGHGLLTSPDGRYVIIGVSAARGARLVVVARRIGYMPRERIMVARAESLHVDFAMATSSAMLSAVTVLPEARPGRPGSRTERGDAAKTTAADASSMAMVQQSYATTNVAPAPAGGVPPYIRKRGAEWNTENYAAIEENPFLAASSNPLSTFSIDVDRASYANVRRFLVGNAMPPRDAVRIEELVNYFRYDYAPPTDARPLAIHTELAAAPWKSGHQLLRIGLQAKRIDLTRAPANNLVFLIDVSGSMQSEDKLPLLRKAFRLLVDQMREEDRVAIVVYAGNAGLVLPSTSGADKERILAAIDGLEAGGSTAGGAGIRLAYDVARRNFIRGGNNRVLLATDGDFNVGVSSDADLVQLIEEKRKEGTFLTVLGVGTGNLKDSRMEQLADKGNGNYAYIDNLMEAKKTLVTEMGGTLVTVAKDVKLQVEFNPARVAGYRLLGYENRALRAEDFNDDAKDAGELGSGHTVTALYEIVPVGADSDVALRGIDSLRYQRPASTPPVAREGAREASGELAFVKVRYKAPDGEVSRLMEQPVAATPTATPSTDFVFAAAVAEFGLLLRESPHKAEASWSQVAALARRGKGADPEGYRAEFIRLVDGVRESVIAERE